MTVPHHGTGGAGGSPAAGTGRSAPFPWLSLFALAAAGAAVSYLVKWPCRFGGAWNDGTQHDYGCYSDIYPLYFRDGLDAGTVPYLDQPVEYPVLIGGLMHALARAVSWLPDPVNRGLAYFDVTAFTLALGLLMAVWGTGYLAGRGGVEPVVGATPFDTRAALPPAAFVAVAPAGVLTAYINWDLLAVGLAVGFLVAYARGLPWLAGVLLGLAVAAKFYPVLFLGPLAVLLLRDRLRGGGWHADPPRVAGAAVLAWALVNLPVYLASPAGWATFFEFSQERGADWGSVYYLLRELGPLEDVSTDTLNTVGTSAFLLCCVGIGLVGLLARRRPPLAQLLFLVVAAFLMTNKVWSPQFVLWLLPLAALAWPRRVPQPAAALVFAGWQLAELGYVIGVWPYIERQVAGPGDPGAAAVGIGFEAYAMVALARLFGLVAVCVLVTVDCLRSGEECPS